MFNKEWIDWKINLINQRARVLKINNWDVPLFSFIEYNLSNRCTRDCDFCPAKNDNIFKYMSTQTYIESLNQLYDVDFSGLIIYSGFSEPMLHPDLDQLISATRDKLPNVVLGITSNGDLATKERIKEMFDRGLDVMAISLYDGEHQVESFNSIIQELNLADHIFLRRRFSKNDMIYCNRAGALPTDKDTPIKKRSFYPFYMLYIDYNGDVLFCSHDFDKHLVLGNVSRDHLLQLWTGDLLEAIRLNLDRECRTHSPCSKCDVLGTVMGENHLLKWRNMHAR